MFIFLFIIHFFVHRLPSGVTTVVRNLPPGTVFYEPGAAATHMQSLSVGGQTVSTTMLHQPQHFHHPVPHHQAILLKCSLCSEVFQDKAKFRQHAFMHEQVSLLKNDLPQMLKPGTYECKFCHAIFDDKEKLKLHYTEKHEKEYVHTQPIDQLYQCSMCDLRFLQFNALVQHQQTHSQRKEVYILPKQQLQGSLLKSYFCFSKKIFLDRKNMLLSYHLQCLSISTFLSQMEPSLLLTGS